MTQHPLPLPLFRFPLPPLSLEVGPLKSSYGIWGSAVSSPQRDLGQSPSRNRIWCILVLKYDILLVATILIIFLRIKFNQLTKSKLCPPAQLPYFCPSSDFCNAFCVAGPRGPGGAFSFGRPWRTGICREKGSSSSLFFFQFCAKQTVITVKRRGTHNELTEDENGDDRILIPENAYGAYRY